MRIILTAAAMAAVLFLMGAQCQEQVQQHEQVVQRANQYEAKGNLMSLFTSETMFFAENTRYSGDFTEIGFDLQGKRDYAYFLPNSTLQPNTGEKYQLPPGVKLRADNQGFLAAAVANLDADPTLDVWTIDQDRNLVNVVNDLVR